MRSRVLGLAAITLTSALGSHGHDRQSADADRRGPLDYRSQVQSAAHPMG